MAVPETDAPKVNSLAQPLSRRASALAVLTDAPEIGRHTAAFVCAILSIWVVDLFLSLLLGRDAKFYDSIPVRYVTDTGHLAVLVRYVWQLILAIGRKP